MAVWPPTVAKAKVEKECGIDQTNLDIKSQEYDKGHATIVLADKEGKEYKVEGDFTPPPAEDIQRGIIGGGSWDMKLVTKDKNE